MGDKMNKKEKKREDFNNIQLDIDLEYINEHKVVYSGALVTCPYKNVNKGMLFSVLIIK